MVWFVCMWILYSYGQRQSSLSVAGSDPDILEVSSNIDIREDPPTTDQVLDHRFSLCCKWNFCAWSKYLYTTKRERETVKYQTN